MEEIIIISIFVLFSSFVIFVLPLGYRLNNALRKIENLEMKTQRIQVYLRQVFHDTQRLMAMEYAYAVRVTIETPKELLDDGIHYFMAIDDVKKCVESFGKVTNTQIKFGVSNMSEWTWYTDYDKFLSRVEKGEN